jgi:hypothetical protein
MSASKEQRADWPASDFFERLDRLEGRHQHLQRSHDTARRHLDCAGLLASVQLRDCWRNYCQVVVELDRAAADFEALRS